MTTGRIKGRCNDNFSSLTPRRCQWLKMSIEKKNKYVGNFIYNDFY